MNQASIVTTLCLLARSAAAGGHGLDLTLALSKTSFLPGEHVFVTVALSNSSAQPLNCVYPMNPGQGFLKLEIRDQETAQMIAKNCHTPSYICPVPGCELAPGAEHVEVIAVTQCYGIQGLDAPKLPPPLLPHAGALPEGVYRMSAVYATPSCSGTESYVLASNSVDFRVVSPAETPNASIWWNLAASFHTNDSVYRDALSSLVEEHIDEPFVASLYLESSLFHQSATRRESSLRIVN